MSSSVHSNGTIFLSHLRVNSHRAASGKLQRRRLPLGLPLPVTAITIVSIILLLVARRATSPVIGMKGFKIGKFRRYLLARDCEEDTSSINM